MMRIKVLDFCVRFRSKFLQSLPRAPLFLSFPPTLQHFLPFAYQTPTLDELPRLSLPYDESNSDMRSDPVHRPRFKDSALELHVSSPIGTAIQSAPISRQDGQACLNVHASIYLLQKFRGMDDHLNCTQLGLAVQFHIFYPVR